MCLERNVGLLPSQRKGEPIMDGLLQNLQKTVLHLTSDVGMVMEIIRILSYGRGMITDTNFSAVAVFPVVYEAIVCSPNKDMEVVCRVDNMVTGTLLVTNGRLKVSVYTSEIDPNIFSYEDGALVHLSSKAQIKIGDLMVVTLTQVTKSQNMPDISASGILTGVASEADKQLYYNENKSFAPVQNEDFI